ncbi:MAG: hypothetical protein MUF31_04650 [Akkermansiaceae bacterium]|jgi:hypothetical protein|nr:hypothetical protein [Akkermansiaceae bacterium]
MARRKSNSDGELSLDSLMDALTNVVAVLILVLILVQVDVSRTVERIMEVDPATPEQVAASRTRLAELEKKQKQRLDLLEAAAPDPKEEEKIKQDLALLEKEVAENRGLLAEKAEVVALEKTLRQKRDAAKAESDKLQKRIAELEAMLDSTPVKVARPDIVSIPASRPIPPDARVHPALVFGGRIHFIDPFTPLDRFMREFDREKRNWVAERVKRRNAPDVIRYDTAKILKHFAGFDFGNRRGQKVELISRPEWGNLRIRITPDPAKGGTETALLTKPGSPFHQEMRAVARIRNAVVMFRVNPDSIPTYLAARTLADAVNVPAGWDMSWNKSHEYVITDFLVKPTGKAPPAQPPTGPQPPRIDPMLD